MTCAKKHVSTSSSQQSCGLLCSYDIQISMSNPVSRTVNRFRPAAPSGVLHPVSETAYIVYQFHVLVSSDLFHLFVGSSSSFSSVSVRFQLPFSNLPDDPSFLSVPCGKQVSNPGRTGCPIRAKPFSKALSYNTTCLWSRQAYFRRNFAFICVIM